MIFHESFLVVACDEVGVNSVFDLFFDAVINAAFSIQIIESLLFSLTADRRSSIWLDKAVQRSYRAFRDHD